MRPPTIGCMPERDKDLPIFELPLVLLPGERIPLHIFEERYKRMIGVSLEQDQPFGVVFRDDDGARSIGCAARVEEVLEQFDDGRMNIVVTGEERFRVLDRFDSNDFPQGEVEWIAEEEAEAGDIDAAASAREAFAELAERATGDRPSDEELEGSSSYEIAARVELPADTKQRLLEMRDEDERMTLLANALRAVEKALDRAEEVAEHARGNGKVSFS
ncbi:MAG: peptidase S16 [Solirubrobacterales bacterium]|nr:peptidase S16 [Solirubrobacterales bacterium]